MSTIWASVTVERLASMACMVPCSVKFAVYETLWFFGLLQRGSRGGAPMLVGVPWQAYKMDSRHELVPAGQLKRAAAGKLITNQRLI